MKSLLVAISLFVSVSSFAQNSAHRPQMKQVKPSAPVITVGSKYSLIGKIKSCLATVYTIQTAYHSERGTYISSNQEFVNDSADSCGEFDVTTEVANQREFRVIARSGNEIWSVNQNKEITQLR